MRLLAVYYSRKRPVWMLVVNLSSSDDERSNIPEARNLLSPVAHSVHRNCRLDAAAIHVETVDPDAVVETVAGEGRAVGKAKRDATLNTGARIYANRRDTGRQVARSVRRGGSRSTRNLQPNSFLCLSTVALRAGTQPAMISPILRRAV